MSHDSVYQQIKAAGYVKLHAHYQGGNDEGGADEVTAVKADGSEESFGWDDPMSQLVNDVLSEKYGSWAGEFEAYGTITIDADKRDITMVGEESGPMAQVNEVWA